MEKINIVHSMKNIPIPSRREYTKLLVLKMESFLRRLRWRIIHLDDLKDPEDTEPITMRDTYGFKSEYKPNPVPELEAFEKEIEHFHQYSH